MIFFHKIKAIIAVVIFLNLIIMGMFYFITKQNLVHYKAHLVEFGSFVLNTLERGNRVIMMNMGFSRNNLQRLAEEISKNENVKNLVIFDANKKPIFSINPLGEKSSLPEIFTIKTTDSEIIISKPIEFNIFGNMIGMMGQGRFRHNQEDNSQEKIKIYAQITMNLEKYSKMKQGAFLNLGFAVVSEILLIMAAFYLWKLFSSYSKTQEKLKVMEKDAELGRFASMLAHEIKNPLSSMKGIIEFVQKKQRDDSLKVYLANSLEEIERLNKIVNDFLSFGREIVLNKKSESLKQLILKTLEIISHDLDSKSVSIQIDGEDFYVNVDRDKILQVFLNLFLNAVEASPEGEVVYVKFYPKTKSLKIENKVLNKQFDVEKIFDPFYTTKSKGSGLGLTVSKKIIELHEGKIGIAHKDPFEVHITFES